MRNKHKRIITAHELCYLLSTRGRTEKTFKNGQRDHVNQNGCPTTVGTIIPSGSIKAYFDFLPFKSGAAANIGKYLKLTKGDIYVGSNVNNYVDDI